MDVKSLPWAPSPRSPSCIHTLVHCHSVIRGLQSASLVPGPGGREQRGLCSRKELAFRWGGANAGAHNERPVPNSGRWWPTRRQRGSELVHRGCRAGQARAPPQGRARLHGVWRARRSPRLGLGHRKRGSRSARPRPAAQLPSAAGASRADCAGLTRARGLHCVGAARV